MSARPLAVVSSRRTDGLRRARRTPTAAARARRCTSAAAHDVAGHVEQAGARRCTRVGHRHGGGRGDVGRRSSPGRTSSGRRRRAAGHRGVDRQHVRRSRPGGSRARRPRRPGAPRRTRSAGRLGGSASGRLPVGATTTTPSSHSCAIRSRMPSSSGTASDDVDDLDAEARARPRSPRRGPGRRWRRSSATGPVVERGVGVVVDLDVEDLRARRDPDRAAGAAARAARRSGRPPRCRGSRSAPAACCRRPRWPATADRRAARDAGVDHRDDHALRPAARPSLRSRVEARGRPPSLAAAGSARSVA